MLWLLVWGKVLTQEAHPVNKCVLCIMKYNVQQKQQRKKNWSPVEEIHFPACIYICIYTTYNTYCSLVEQVQVLSHLITESIYS